MHRRPWWGNPLLWLAVCAVFLVLGLVVAPHFLPGAVVFLPFVWIGGWGGRRRRPEDGR
jgi:NhaP-type Na+/H+ and K+/H+ antiporter